MNGSTVDGFFDYYHFNKRHSETTMPLYWMMPNEYIALDTRNRKFLQNKYGIETKDSITDFATYKAFCNSLKDKINNKEIRESSISEISYQAYLYRQEDTDYNIWFVRDPDDDQFDYCVSEGSLFFNTDNKIGDMSLLGDDLKSFSISLGETETIKKSMAYYTYWQLSHLVKEDDVIVYFRTKKDVLGWGYVTGTYTYDVTNKFHHSVGVEWNKVDVKDSTVKHSSGLWFKDRKYNEVKPLLDFLGIKTDKSDNKMNQYQPYIDILKENHNLVLTGAPGTGKTFMAKAIAKEMDAVTEFVQFHPSYDYTDFVEGLRPKKDNSQMGFERKDGIFKTFCKQAILNEATEDNSVMGKFNSDPKVWKVSLGGTYDNPIRTDCLANGYIRIGWDKYGDVEDFNDMQDYPDGGRVILRAFQSEMQIGDIIVSCYSQYETDAIGIITGDYEYRSEGADYPRYRTVEWLIKDKKINIQDVLGKRMTLSTIYKLNVPVTDILELVKKNNGLAATTTKKDRPFVMIVDEINRGELSKIFGELFFAIDPGYRGTKGTVKTQYQNLVEKGDEFENGFYVPENVYILATMNDIDRSVESMDFAMRRRFTWKEVTPADTESMLDNLQNAEEVKSAMHRLNKEIAETDGLGTAYMVGPSYFLKLGKPGYSMEKLWAMNLEPLLKEYLRGFRKVEDTMKRFKNAYINTTASAD